MLRLDIYDYLVNRVKLPKWQAEMITNHVAASPNVLAQHLSTVDKPLYEETWNPFSASLTFGSKGIQGNFKVRARWNGREQRYIVTVKKA